MKNKKNAIKTIINIFNSDISQNLLKIEGKDIDMFYILLSHYNIQSNNIGIVCTNKKFISHCKSLMSKYKNKNNISIRFRDNKLTVIKDDIETIFINIQNIYDLDDVKTNRKLFFKKFVKI